MGIFILKGRYCCLGWFSVKHTECNEDKNIDAQSFNLLPRYLALILIFMCSEHCGIVG